MVSNSCTQWRADLAAWVLGELDGAEAEALVAHLTDCECCRAESAELTEVAGALRLADPLRAQASPPQPRPELGAAVADRIAAERAETRRGRLRGLVAAAAALVALAVVGAVAWWPGSDEEPTRVAATVTDAVGGVEATVDVEERGWGASVNIVASGLEEGAVYRVWVEDTAGERQSAGTFLGVGGEEIRCYMAAATPFDDVAVVGIDAPDGTPVLRGMVAASERTTSR